VFDALCQWEREARTWGIRRLLVACCCYPSRWRLAWFAGAYGMDGLISAHAGLRSSLPVRRSSAARPLPASQVPARFTSPPFRSAKVCKSRGLEAAALEVSKDCSSAVLANLQPSKGCSFFFLFWSLPKVVWDKILCSLSGVHLRVSIYTVSCE
jgi:hypothetical protein